jgi:ABC-type bacteriocin/lantibiotic exporter with double-glycine peptidase domain
MPPVILTVPHLQQDEHGECLAACAWVALAYLGLTFPYKQLLGLFHVRVQLGTPAYNIRRLEQLGVTVLYQQGTLTELYDHLVNDRPCIVFLKTGELPYWDEVTDHAVVVVGMDDELVYVNDPEFPSAPIQIAQGDFDLAWLGRDEFYATLMPRS